MPIDQIIFDCDGVLIDSEITAAEIMVPVLKSLGQKIEIQHYLDSYTGKTFRNIFSTLSIDSRIDIEMLLKNVEEKVYANIKAIDGIVELVKSINLPKSVVSNSSLDQITTALTEIKLLDEFQHQFSSTMVALPKPSPEIYLYAASKLGVSPASCLVIEDSVSGVTAAAEAGMNVVGLCAGGHISPGHADKLRKAGAKYIADDMPELRILINKVNKNELNFSNS